MNKAFIIFSGYNFRAIIAFIRTLEKNSIKYGIIAKSHDDEIFQTIYRKHILFVRKTTLLEVKETISIINKVKKQLLAKEYIIAPSTEALNRFILNNILEFQKNDCIFPSVKKELYENISDKYSFGNLCLDYDINIPKEFKILEVINFPFVAKPITYITSDAKIFAPQIIKDKTELNNFKNNFKENDFYYQEFVEGRSIYLLYYFHKNGKVDKFSQENFIQQEDGKSMLYAKSSSFHTHSESRKFENLFNDISFRGLVMIELKYHHNEFIMIEANPRFWGPAQLFVDAGVNLFESLLEDYKVLKAKEIITINSDVEYFWNDGILSNIEHRNHLSFYNYSKNDFKNDLNRLTNIEIFNRSDTFKLYKGKNLTDIEQLKKMYAKTSKHSNYQILASELQKYLPNKDIDVKSRNEIIRLNYFLDKVDIQNRKILDIGGNTGYFTFEFLKNGASSLEYYEGNKEHSEFVKLSSKVLNYEDKLTVYDEYYNFDKNDKYDVILLLNVLHHLGDDFGNNQLTKEKALENIIIHMRNIAKHTEILVFQLGFNWKGNNNLPLFKNGTKEELIDFISKNLVEEFDILHIGIAERSDDVICYSPLNEDNIKRYDSLGEFLNRPIFIMKSNIFKVE